MGVTLGRCLTAQSGSATPGGAGPSHDSPPARPSRTDTAARWRSTACRRRPGSSSPIVTVRVAAQAPLWNRRVDPNGGIVRIVGYGCRGEGGANLHRHMGRRAGGPKYRHHNRAEPGQCAHGFILRAAPGPMGTRGRDRGTTRHACAAPSWLGSIWGRGVRCRRAGTGPIDPCRTRPSACFAA